MKSNTIVIILLVLLGLSVGTVLYFRLFDTQSIICIMAISLAYLAGYLYLVFSLQEARDNDANKKTLDYCWAKTNEILQKMAGGDKLEWYGGIGRKSEDRTYFDGPRKKSYKAFFGYLSRAKQPVVIIFNMDDDDIARYIANPNPELLADPFKGFQPFNNGDMARMMGMGFGLKGKQRKRFMAGIQSSGLSGYDGRTMPDSSYVDSASNPGGSDDD